MSMQSSAQPLPSYDGFLLRSGSISLRTWRVDDEPALLAAGNDSRIQEWMPGMPAPYGPEEACWFLEHARSWWLQRSRVELAVVGADEVVGLTEFALRSENGHLVGHVGYWVLPEHRGRGYAARALGLMTSWALELGVVDEMLCRVDPDNTASRRVAEAAGYRLLRVDHDAYRRAGRQRDLEVFHATRTGPPGPSTRGQGYREGL